MFLITGWAQETTNAPNLSVVSAEGPLLVGWASADITPLRPVALIGQLHKRISTGVRDPLTATVLVLEVQRRGAPEQAVLVSCDLLFIQRRIEEQLQARLRRELSDLDSTKVFLNATHTHTGPGLVDSTFKGLYDVDKDPGVMKASEYAEFFLARVVDAVVSAWKGRKPSSMGWALSQAVVSYNRRAQFQNGKTVMYGDTRTPEFENIEGPEDHTVGLLFFWDAATNWSGVVVNVACPAQETEHLDEISADFWHEVRTELRRRHGERLFVLPQCAPAGDLSPHPIYRKEAEELLAHQRGLSRREEIARRIVNAIEDGLPIAKAGHKSELLFRHTVATAELPEQPPDVAPFYETDSVRPMQFHVLRLGEVGMATSPFELYLDYGIRIQARSPAVPTLLVQLCGGSGYLPTARAVRGGGYSADKYLVGPDGGRVLVEETVRQLNSLFP